MNNVTIRKQAKAFAEYWKDKGYEKEQSKAFHGAVSKETWNEFVKKYIGEETFEQYKFPF